MKINHNIFTFAETHVKSNTQVNLLNICDPNPTLTLTLRNKVHKEAMLFFQVRDPSQEPCGRLTFLKECKTMKGLPQTAVCNLNITLPAVKKVRRRELPILCCHLHYHNHG